MVQKELKVIPQKIFSSSRIYPNDREVAHAEKINAIDLLDMSFIAKVHKFGSKEIHKLNNNETENLIVEFDNYQNSYQDSYVLNYFQFNKGHKKSQEQMEVIEESQISSNSPAFLFYEQDQETDEGACSDRLQEIRTKTDKEIWIVLEIESNRLLEKIKSALLLGEKNFIVRAGKYDDLYLWNAVISNIQENDGKIMVALPRRHHKRISYIKDFFSLGVDGVFHEVPNGWSESILHLTPDYTYVEMSFEEAVEGYSEDLINLSKSFHYGFSRVRALNIANNFAGTIEVLQIIEKI